MTIKKSEKTLTITTDTKNWEVPIGQCYKVTDTNIYKLDNEYILFENEDTYGLLKIVERGFK